MIYCEGLEYPEAPVLTDDGQWLIAQMKMGTGCVSKISQQGNKITTVIQTGRPNGLLLDKDRYLWIAESWKPALLKIKLDSNIDTSSKQDSEPFYEYCNLKMVAEGINNKTFLWPNDLVSGPDGLIYMTDSGIKVNQLFNSTGNNFEVWKQPMAGALYRINPVSENVELLDDGFHFYNGLAFGPDNHLYVAETGTGIIYRYNFNDSLQICNRDIFTHLPTSSDCKQITGPDGMAFDECGNLYVAMFGLGHIAVINHSGKTERKLPTRGSSPTNVAFGPMGSKMLYVTEFENGRLEALKVPYDGFHHFDSSILLHVS